MKKVAVFLLAVVSVLSLCAFAACGETKEAKVTGITYVSGMPEEVTVNRTPDYSALKIKASYDDNTEKEITYNAKDFTVEFDNKTIAENVKVKITYKGFTCETTVNVTNKYFVGLVEQPEFVTAYKSVSNSDFKDKTAPYYVGNYNEFLFVPVVTMVNATNDIYEVKESGELEFAAEVLLVDGDATSTIENAADYYTYDGERSAFKFTAAADGKTFRISARPVDLNETQMANVKRYTVTFDVTVKDGYYNVYNAVDLLVMENRVEKGNNSSDAQAMSAFKKAKGIDFNTNDVKGIALQANVELTQKDLPAEYFWTAEEVGSYTKFIGSLKDSVYMIRRELGKDGQFAIEGNYFTLNTETMPKVLVESNTKFDKNANEVIAHSKLFFVAGGSQHNDTTNTESFAINNINCLGNINRTDGDTTGEGENFQSGGLIFMEVNGAKVDLNNCIAKCWYITAFSSQTSENHFLTVNKCIFVDDYNSIFYLWGGIIEIKESDTYGAGGPVFIADHVYYDRPNEGRTGSGGWISDIRIDESSNVYSYVTGQEGWFKQMNATNLAGQITAFDDGLFNKAGYSFRKTIDGKRLMNIVAIYKPYYTYSVEELFNDSISGKGKFGKNEFTLNGGYIDTFLSTPINTSGGTVGNSGMTIFYGAAQTSLIAYNPNPQAQQEVPFVVSFERAMTGGASNAIVTSMEQLKALSIMNDNGGYLNALIGYPGKSGKIGVVFGDYGKVA